MSRIDLPPVPIAERCAQTGITPDWHSLQHVEAHVHAFAIAAMFPPPPGVRLIVGAAAHDFGRYMTLSAQANDEDALMDWAASIEDAPTFWLEYGIVVPPASYYRGARDPSVHHRTALACIADNLQLDIALAEERAPLRERYATLMAEAPSIVIAR